MKQVWSAAEVERGLRARRGRERAKWRKRAEVKDVTAEALLRRFLDGGGPGGSLLLDGKLVKGDGKPAVYVGSMKWVPDAEGGGDVGMLAAKVNALAVKVEEAKG